MEASPTAISEISAPQPPTSSSFYSYIFFNDFAPLTLLQVSTGKEFIWLTHDNQLSFKIFLKLKRLRLTTFKFNKICSTNLIFGF